MDRLIIVGFVVCILIGLAVAGWHFQPAPQDPETMCASADAHCGERRL
jgi:hypothetical protein